MNQKTQEEIQTNKPNQESRHFWITIIAVIITTIVGGGVYTR